MTKIIGSAALTAPDPEGENLTQKGDLHGYSSENTRIPIGDNDQVLTADSAQALGLKWAAASSSWVSTASSNYSYWIIKLAFGAPDGGETVRFRVNNSSAANYQSNMILNTAGTLSATTEDAQTSALIVTEDVAVAGSSTCQLTMNLLLSPQNASPGTYHFIWSISDAWDQQGSSPSDTQQSTGFFNYNGLTSLSKIDFFLSGGSDFSAESTLRLYGVKKV